MATRREVITAVRQLRNDVMAGRRNARTVTEKLRYQCERISDLPINGQDWSSWEMPDPLFDGERGHSLRIVPLRGVIGWVVSLTGRIILGKVSDMNNEEKTRQELEQMTGAGRWTRRSTRR